MIMSDYLAAGPAINGINLRGGSPTLNYVITVSRRHRGTSHCRPESGSVHGK